LSCNTTVPDSPDTVPPIEYVVTAAAARGEAAAAELEKTSGVMSEESAPAVPPATANAGGLLFVVLPLLFVVLPLLFVVVPLLFAVLPLLFAVLPLTGGVTVTSGATVSTVQDLWAGVGSSRPEGLIARTSTLCAPSTSPV
jgi:hypothetical protein